LAKKPLRYAALIHDVSQVLYLPFDWDDGSYTRDRSGHGNHGTIYGASRTSGKIGMALSFDGVDDYVEAPDDPTLNFGTGDFTIEFWKKGYTEIARLLDKRVNTFGYEIVDRNNVISVFIGGTLAWSHPDVGTTNINDNLWHHIAVVWRASVLEISAYLDGKFDGSTTISDPGNIDSTSDLYIGAADAGASAQFAGIVDELRFYKRALSANEIPMLMYRRLI